MSISDVDVVKPSGLNAADDAGPDDVIIREQDSDGAVVKQTVANLLGGGPYTCMYQPLVGGNVTVTNSSSSILELGTPAAYGMYAESAWWNVSTENEIIIPGTGYYLFMVQIEIEGGQVGAGYSVELIEAPNGSPTSLMKSSGYTGGGPINISSHFMHFGQLSAGDKLGVRVNNDGLTAFDVVAANTRVFAIKLY